MNKIKNIFEHTDCLSEERLIQYLSDKLSLAEKHNVERHLVDCEMCSDAVEGMRLISDKQRISSITSELNQKIQNRVEKKEVRIFFLWEHRTQFAAAAAILCIVGLFFFFWNNVKEMDSESSEQIFADKFEPYPSEEEKETPSLLKTTEKQIDNSNAVSLPQEPPSKPQTLSDVPAESKVGKETFDKNSQINEKEGEEVQVQDGYVNAIKEEISAEKDKAETMMKVKDDANKPEMSPSAVVTGAASEAYTRSERNKAKPDKKKSADNKASAEGAVSTQFQNAMSAPAPESKAAQMEMSAPDTVSAIEEDAMRKYEGQDYSNALIDFEQVLKQRPDDEKALFYSAVSYLSLGQTDKAVVNFEKVLSNKNGEYYDAAKWYSSLAYIKKKETQKARSNLLELKNNSKSRYQKQASETLDEMNK